MSHDVIYYFCDVSENTLKIFAGQCKGTEWLDVLLL